MDPVTIGAIITGAVTLLGGGLTWWISRKNAANTPAQKTNAVAARDAQLRTEGEAALQSTDDSKFEKGVSE